MKSVSAVLVASLLLITAPVDAASPILISGWLTNVNGDDSPYEYAQFVASQDMDFASTPFTIVWNDVGLVGSTGTASFSDGWSGGSLLSYAFQLTAGTVTRGEVFYIGGSAQVLAGPGSTSFANQRWLRTLNTSFTGGDGLGAADSTGVFGNGGPNADGIAVFPGLAAAITASTTPVDAIFFGSAVGTAHPANGGFKATDNDHYTSRGVFGDAGNDFLFPDLNQNQYMRLSGAYNSMTGQWESPRSGTVLTLNSSSSASAIASAITLIPEPAAGLLTLTGLKILSLARMRRPSASPACSAFD